MIGEYFIVKLHDHNATERSQRNAVCLRFAGVCVVMYSLFFHSGSLEMVLGDFDIDRMED